PQHEQGLVKPKFPKAHALLLDCIFASNEESI
ncbi:hypothetical protein CCACVL1_09213, partial [Corchorus capsularis]